jgi:acyl-CoA reductase-like NAD-dependent aldehyde dehydrogenase
MSRCSNDWPFADGMVLGDGFDPATQMGPLVSARQRDRVAGFVEGARAQGARGRPCARSRGLLSPDDLCRCGAHDDAGL